MAEPRLYRRWNPATPGDTRFAGLYVPLMSLVDPCPPVIEAHLTAVSNVGPFHTFPSFHRFQMTSESRTRAGWDNPAMIDGFSSIEAEFLPFWNSSPGDIDPLTYIGGVAVNNRIGGSWTGQFALWPQDETPEAESRPWRFTWRWRMFWRGNINSYLEYDFFPINDSLPSRGESGNRTEPLGPVPLT